MAKKCEVCGKGPWFGKQVTFSHKRSSKKWSANIQTGKVKLWRSICLVMKIFRTVSSDVV